MALTIYQLKPAFQDLLRPVVEWLWRRGVTANQVTLFACAGSLLLGLALFAWPLSPVWFALLPPRLFARMALNAMDGMLAREFDQKSALGAYLNELTDVISDAALLLPFARLAPFEPLWLGTLIFVAALSEMAGALGPTVGAGRRYDGPFGKSDRAFAFGALALAAALWQPLPDWLAFFLPIAVALTALTTVNRVRAGLQESR